MSIAVQNPFQKPQSLPQWLLSSVCWTFACLGGLAFISTVLLKIPGEYTNLRFTICLCGALVAHVLIWWKAVEWKALDTNWRMRDAKHGQLWLAAAAKLWLTGLLVFQVLCSFMLLGAIGLIGELLGISSDSGGGTFFSF